MAHPHSLSVAVPFSVDILHQWCHFIGYRNRLQIESTLADYEKISSGLSQEQEKIGLKADGGQQRLTDF